MLYFTLFESDPPSTSLHVNNNYITANSSTTTTTIFVTNTTISETGDTIVRRHVVSLRTATSTATSSLSMTTTNGNNASSFLMYAVGKLTGFSTLRCHTCIHRLQVLPCEKIGVLFFGDFFFFFLPLMQFFCVILVWVFLLMAYQPLCII